MNKLLQTTTLVAAFLLGVGTLGAQATPDSTARRQQRTLDSLIAVIRTLQQRIDSLERARASGDTTGGAELAAIRAAAAAASTDSAAAAQPQQTRLGQNALNPEISVAADVRLYARSPGAQSDNFVPREFEFAFQSALDPFSTAKIFVSAEDGEVDVEEGYVYFTALPGHLRLDVGKFRQLVGELNRWHLHALQEDEYPLVVRRFAGEEGLAAPGVSVYWPLPFSGGAGTYELTVQATSGDNDVLFAGGRRPSANAQLAGFWQFNRSAYGQLSVSGLYGRNADTSLTTTLGILAGRFSWRPPQRAMSRELTLRGELWALRRKFDLPEPDAFNRARLGGYVQGIWRLNRQFVASLRGDVVQSPDPGPLTHEWAVTPALTFWQSEFVYVRGLFERAKQPINGMTSRLTLQVVFAMGPHKHELF